MESCHALILSLLLRLRLHFLFKGAKSVSLAVWATAWNILWKHSQLLLLICIASFQGTVCILNRHSEKYNYKRPYSCLISAVFCFFWQTEFSCFIWISFLWVLIYSCFISVFKEEKEDKGKICYFCIPYLLLSLEESLLNKKCQVLFR